MFRPFTPSFALASLLVGLTATVQATPAGRSVVIAGSSGESPVLYVAPGTVTVILLGAQIVRESVQVEGRARFAVFEVVEGLASPSETLRAPDGERGARPALVATASGRTSMRAATDVGTALTSSCLLERGQREDTWMRRAQLRTMKNV